MACWLQPITMHCGEPTIAIYSYKSVVDSKW
uniref:Uncharacterized protein n=1 Tax=Anguilla anguilla TaxID=7936 RepID=A0A0E9WL21_ANGAN